MTTAERLPAEPDDIAATLQTALDAIPGAPLMQIQRLLNEGFLDFDATPDTRRMRIGLPLGSDPRIAERWATDLGMVESANPTPGTRVWGAVIDGWYTEIWACVDEDLFAQQVQSWR